MHDLDHTSEEKLTTDITRKKKESKLTLEKKIQKLAHEIAGTPESPLTESGLFTDTGISSLDITGDKLRTRKLPLDLREPTTDTDMDYSELSPSSIGHDLPPFSPEQSEGLDSTHNLAAALESNTSSIRSTQYGAHCDAQLSPILFLDNKATSPMGVRGTAELLRTTKDASSSPPQHTMHSASTSPPQKGDLDPSRTSTQATTPNEPTNRDIDYQSSLDFELELNCPMAEEAVLKKNITLERVQTENSLENRRSVEDLAKCFEDMATEEISKRPQSLHSEKGLPITENEELNLETPGREAYREEQVVEIEIEHKELKIMDKTYKLESFLNTEVWPSKGNLNFVLVKAQNLQKKDIFSKSDPYATISFQGTHQSTETIKNNNNPEWNHQIALNITDYQNLEIGIEIFNKKKIGKDDSLGYVTLNSQELSNLNSWVDLKGCKKGQVFVFSEFIPEEILQSLEKKDKDLLKLTTQPEKRLKDQNTNDQERDRKNLDFETQKLEHEKFLVKAQEIEEAPKLKLSKQHEEAHMHEAQEFEGQKIEKDSQKMKVLKLEESNNIAEGILQLTIHCGESLTNKDVFGKSDPYVMVEYDNKKHRSESVKNNLNPKFEFVVSLIVNKDSSDEIYINMFDEDIGKDDDLGFAVLNVGDLIRQNADIRVVELMNVKSGEIHFSSSFYPKETIKESNKLEEAESFEEIKNSEEAQVLLEKVKLETPQKLETQKLKETQKFKQVNNLEEEKETKQVQNLMENQHLEKVKELHESHMPEESKKKEVQKLEEEQEKSIKIEEVQKLEESKKKDDTQSIKIEEAEKLEKRNKVEKEQNLGESKKKEDTQSIQIEEAQKFEEEQKLGEKKKKEDTQGIKIEEAQKLEERNKVEEVQKLEESKKREVNQSIKIEVAQKLEEVQKLGESKKKEDTQSIKIKEAQKLEERNKVEEVQKPLESKKREDKQIIKIEVEQKLEERNKLEVQRLKESKNLEDTQNIKIEEAPKLEEQNKLEEVQRFEESKKLEDTQNIKIEESEKLKDTQNIKIEESEKLEDTQSIKIEEAKKLKDTQSIKIEEAKKLENTQNIKIEEGQNLEKRNKSEEVQKLKERFKLEDVQNEEERNKLEEMQKLKDSQKLVESINIEEDSMKKIDIGILKLIIHCGKNLANKDVFGKSDPYVVVEYDSHKYRSKTVKNNLNPKFEFAVDLIVDKDSSDEIYINLFDEDIGKDDALGFAVLNVGELIRQSADIKVVELMNVKSGELYISSIFHQKEIDSEKEEPKSYQEALKESQKPKADKEANELSESKTVGEAQSLKKIQKPEIAEKLKDTNKIEERIMMEESQNLEEVRKFEKSKKLKEVWELEIDQQLQEAHKPDLSKENKWKFEENYEFDKAQNLQNMQVLMESKRNTEKEHVCNTKPDGVLQLNIHNGKNLANKDTFGKSDPYVVVEYGSNKYRSKTVKNNLNPIFEFGVSFIIDKNSSDEININLFDEDIGKDDALGFAVLNVGELIRQNADIRVVELMNVKSGELCISTFFSPNETKSVQELTVVKTSEETSFRKLQETDEFLTMRDIVKDEAYIETEKQKSVVIESKSSATDNKKRDTISLHIHRVKQLLLENPVPLNIFVTVSLDSEVKKSFKTIYNETIVFDFKCHFGVDEGSGETLIIKIFAGDRDEDSQCLGQFILSIDEVKDKCILETWMPLSNTKSGDIQLSAQYKTIIYEPVVKAVLSRQTFSSQQEAEMPVEEEKVILQMTNLGIEDISIIDNTDANEERILLENVSKLQNNMAFKIEELVGTISYADKTLLTTDNINYFSSNTNLDNCGNITEFTSSHSITTESYSFSQSHVDNQGNVFQARDVVFQHKFSPESETSPTFDDVIYNEYPHLSKPTLNQSSEKTEIVNKYWHTTQQPFENISSFRAHFVQSFCDENKFAEKNKTKDQISVDNSKIEDYFNANSKVVDKVVSENQDQDIFRLSQQHFPTTFGLGKFEDDLESGLGMLSPDTTTLRTLDTNEGGLQSLDFVGDLEVLEKDASCSAESYTSELDCFISGSEKEIAENYSDNLIHDGEIFPELKTVSSSEYQSSLLINSVAEWMQPLISCNCLQSKNFWISGEVVREPLQSLNNPDFSSTDTSPSSEMSSKLGCPPRSPLSIVKSLSPTDSVQSLPSSPRKTVRSVSVKKLTSESFSSENDISRSLEIVYVEPEFDPKETFTAQYRTHSPLNNDNSKFEKRKPSFTQLKRPTSHDLRSDSPDKGNLSESDIPSSASPDFFEISKATSAEFTPYVSDIEPVLNKKLTSPTKIIAPYTSSPPVQHVVSNETISPILDILSQTPLRSPEKKFEYVQGNPPLALAHRLGSPQCMCLKA